MPTVRDVAKLAKVSIATVSRVICNENNVIPETRDRVLAAIRDLNYQPNALARHMRSQSTNNIIVIVPDITNTFFSDILRGIESVALANGFQVLIADMQNDRDVEKYYLNALLQRQVDGIISLSANVAKSLIERIATEYPIVVACQYLPNTNIANVTIDNISAAKHITEYLITQGHTCIAHLTNHPTMLLYRDRLNGYFAALAEHQLPIDLELVRYDTPTIEGGYRQMQALLELDKPVTAIFAAGDTMAIGAMKALKNAGKRIPGDFSVVGFDDIEFSSIYDPSLTTIQQPKYEMGCSAMKKLLDLIRNKPLEIQSEILNYKLIVRESSGPVPRKGQD